VSTAAETLAFPPAITDQAAQDADVMAAAAAEFGIEILGPPGIPE
jgi:hypothetical protein